MAEQQVFRLQRHNDGLVVITINVGGAKVNTLKAGFIDQLRQLLQQEQSEQAISGLIFISDKPGCFIAGADIKMIEGCQTAEEAGQLAREGQQMMAEISALPFPVIAAINGSCLGGGLEFAMACHYRLATDESATRLGLPEVKLGLLPGAGGTQRLPQLIGVVRALPLLLSGKTLSARQALRLGLVDDVVASAALLDSALKLARQPRQARGRLPLFLRCLQHPVVMPWLIRLVSRQAKQKSGGHYPATDKILHVVKQYRCPPTQRGYQLEAKAFGELVMSPQSSALRRLFLAASANRDKEKTLPQPLNLRQAGVLGSGLMGGGIAAITALKAQINCRIKDPQTGILSTALRRYERLIDRDIAQQRLPLAFKPQALSRLTADTNWRGFGQCQVVIEAVFEDLATKRQMVADTEHYCQKTTRFATNTSSLSIAAIAAGAQRPENIIGLHYFSPADKMPLVEVIPHAGTSPQTMADILSLAKQQGKTAIVVADRPGFYVNRILTPYLNEALHCLAEGEPIEVIDAALVNFGFPLGPFQLMDEVGLDVAAKISSILAEAYGKRFEAPIAVDKLLATGRRGKKSGGGFYRYSRNWRGKSSRKADPEIYSLLGISPHKAQFVSEIARRCVLMMLAEAQRCLQEGVISTTAQGDLGAVLGLGFPPFLGGPFNYIQQQGQSAFEAMLEQARQKHGHRFSSGRGGEEDVPLDNK